MLEHQFLKTCFFRLRGEEHAEAHSFMSQRGKERDGEMERERERERERWRERRPSHVRKVRALVAELDAATAEPSSSSKDTGPHECAPGAFAFYSEQVFYGIVLDWCLWLPIRVPLRSCASSALWRGLGQVRHEAGGAGPAAQRSVGCGWVRNSHFSGGVYFLGLFFTVF